MAIVRYKNNNFGFDKSIGSALVKSGSASRVIANTLKDREAYHSFFYDEDTYSRNGNLPSSVINSFNDDNTIIFNAKQIVPTYGVESKYFDSSVESLQNNIQHTPNTFYGTSFGTKSVDVKREKYNKILDPNYLQSSSLESIDFKDSESITGNDVKNVLDFNFKLHTPAILCLNKNQDSEGSVGFLDDNNVSEVFTTHSGNMVYFYGKNDGQVRGQGFGSFDYIGDISENVFSSFLSMSDATIGFMTPTSGSIEADSFLSTMSMPIDTFNFPFDGKYKAESRHCIDVSKYITKPFVIEKIYIEAEISNYSQTKQNVSCLNYLNFFILNQTGQLIHNDISFTNNIESSSDGVSIVTTDNFHSLFFDRQPVYTSAEASTDPNAIMEKGYSLSNDLFTIDEVNNNSVFGSERNNKVFTRELISYGTIANFVINAADRPSYEAVIPLLDENCDFFNFHESNSVNNIENHIEYIDKNKKISLEITPRIVNKNTSMPNISEFNIFASKKSSTANGLEIKSNRFSDNDKNINSQNLSELAAPFQFVRIGKGVDISKEAFKESKYTILPGDQLIFGVSLSPDLNLDQDHVVKIHDNISLSFSGYYLENDQKKYYRKQQYNFRNSKKFGFANNKVCDSIGSPEKVLQSGLYNNNKFVGQAGQSIERFNAFSKSFNNSYLSLPNKETYDSNISSNYKILNKVSGETITNSDKDYFKHYFNVNRYGQSSDFTKYSLNTKHYDNSINTIIDCIIKKFKRGFFIDKNPCKTSGSLNFDFSSIQNYNNISSNWLKDNMFFDFTPTKMSPSYIEGNMNGIPTLLPGPLITYVQNTIDIMMFDIEDNIGNKVHFLVRLTPPESIFGGDFDNNYFISSGGSFNSYDSTARFLRSYTNTSESHVYAIIDIPEDITTSFDTNQDGSFISSPKIDEFTVKIIEGINTAYQGDYLSYDLDIANQIKSGISFTRLRLKDGFEGFYNDQSITLEDIESSSITFRFKDGADVYSESDDLVYSGNDPSSGVIEVGIRSPSTGQKDSKRNQIISLLNAINKSSLKIRATQSYDSDIELFISQTSAGSLGDTNVVNTYNNTLSYELGDFENGSGLKSHSFNLAVNASLKEVEDINIRTINIENLTRGKTGNNNINSGTASNVTKENFSVTEGDVINSYNMDENASFVDEELVFKES